MRRHVLRRDFIIGDPHGREQCGKPMTNLRLPGRMPFTLLDLPHLDGLHASRPSQDGGVSGPDFRSRSAVSERP